MYTSTRDPERIEVGYDEALISGMAPDGGLYTPTDLPEISFDELELYQNLPYTGIFSIVHGQFVGKSLPIDVQMANALEAYGPDNFPDAVGGVVTPVRRIGRGLFLLDLSGGPTAAFKDLALQAVGREMDKVLEQRDQKLVLLGATSGDTGSAAEHAVKDRERLKIFMLSPQEGMSEFQAGQMGALTGGNVHNLSVDGAFDDCQDMVKRITANPEFSDLGAVNSINIGRITSQIPYYVAGYLELMKQTNGELGDPMDVVIPSGNFGNALAGHYAREMGIPIRNIILATNENDVLNRLVQTGQYENRGSQITTSPSMDIGKSSNLERLFWEFLGQNGAMTGRFMRQFETEKRVSFVEYGLSRTAMKDAGFRSGTSSHDARVSTIARVYSDTRGREVIDPHTADAVYVARNTASMDIPTLVLSTANPVKFEGIVARAIGAIGIPARSKRFEDIERLGRDGFVKLPNDVEAVMEYIRDNR